MLKMPENAGARLVRVRFCSIDAAETLLFL